MKPKSILFPLVAALALGTADSRSAVILDSGADGTTNSNINSGASGGSGKAVGFTLSTSTSLGPAAGEGYLLESIEVRLGNQFGGIIPSSAYTFSLYSNDSNTSPNSLLATFNSVDIPVATTAFFNLTLSTPFVLNPDSTYWIVATSSITNSQLSWKGTGAEAATSPGISTTTPVARFGTGVVDPANWAGSSSVLNDIRIIASPIPEPSVVMALALGSFAFLGRRR